MRCRNCGAEIAAKALICYRCGTATTEAKYKPVQVEQGRRRARLTGTVVALALLAVLVLALYAGRLQGGDSSRIVSFVAVGVAVLLVAARAYVRRR